MAKLYQADPTGTIGRFHKTLLSEQEYGPLPGALSEFEYDPKTNAELHAELSDDVQRSTRFRLIIGVLTRDGLPLTLNADGEGENIRKQLIVLIQNGRNYVANPSPTNAQTVAAVKGIIRLLLYVIVHRLRLTT